MILAVRLALSEEIPREYWEAITTDEESAGAAYELHKARVQQTRSMMETSRSWHESATF